MFNTGQLCKITINSKNKSNRENENLPMKYQPYLGSLVRRCYFLVLRNSQILKEISFFNKDTGLLSLKKRLQHRCFPVKFARFLRALFLQNTSGACFCTVSIELIAVWIFHGWMVGKTYLRRLSARFNWFKWTAKTNVRGTSEDYETHVLKI